MVLSLGVPSSACAEDAPAHRVSRSDIWHNGPIKFVDTTPFKKPLPYTIGFSNASISNLWAVGYLDALRHLAEQHKDLLKQLIITDANDNSTKQVSDIPDLLQRNVGILIVRPSTEAVDAAVVRAVKKGVIAGRRQTATLRS
jgi:ribose transport system substrate-binding protein